MYSLLTKIGSWGKEPKGMLKLRARSRGFEILLLRGFGRRFSLQHCVSGM